MTNALIRPQRPTTGMNLSGVPAYGIDLAVMLAKLLVAHGYIAKEPDDLEGLLAAGDAALAGGVATTVSKAELLPALAHFRDTVLHQSGALAENGMSSEQVNDVLGEFDDAVAWMFG